MDDKYKGATLNISYQWEDAQALKKELEEYINVLKDFLPSVFSLYLELKKYVD